MSKKYAILGIASLGVVFALEGAWYSTHHHNSSGQNQPSQSHVGTHPDPRPAKPTNTNGHGNAVSTTNDRPDHSETTPTRSQQAAVTLTQISQSGDQLIIKTLVNGATSGTCQLTLSKEGQTVTRSATIGVQTATAATCQGFTIPLSDLPSEGQWKISVTATSNDITSPAAEVTRQIER
ncbi:MAG TPA: hypothetical protein VLF60_00770 [Candidatus Saccharimonadales bacterium]|nr:hypothetical protein [Candidatus Saccharimonadales bacterium]